MSVPVSAGQQSRTIHYRPDIDGLRAVAVLSVILAHAGASYVAGGFLGVDVFFVISGYLITSILKRELGEGRYSLLKFYERRARRILPALLPVLVFCFPLALWLMLPDFRQSFGQSVVATLLFSNNILLAITSGYWDLESSFKPLLHTWSLGVEEQFYVVFPLVLAAVWRFGRRAQISTIIALGLCSFALSEYGWRHSPDVSFYLPTSRAWELMVGCAVAYVVRRERRFDQFLAALSLLAVVGSMMIFDEHVPSPSVFSAIPVFGTAGIILFSRPGTVAYRILSFRPVVFVGLISYSAYLWHQPLFAFARIASLQPPSGWTMAALTIATLVIAAISWRFVEVPFRNRQFIRLSRFVPLVVSMSALLVAGGLVLQVKHGFPRWTYPNVDNFADIDRRQYNSRIYSYELQNFPNNGKYNVLVVGNSVGRDAANVLLEDPRSRNDNIVYVRNYPYCSPEPEWHEQVTQHLMQQADVVVVAIYFKQDISCVERIGQKLSAMGAKSIVYFGPKHFGYNINPFGRVPISDRRNVLATVPQDIVVNNDQFAQKFGPDHYVDLIRVLGIDGMHMRFFDDRGNPLSPDRIHLTRYGAQVIARDLESHPSAAFRLLFPSLPSH